MVDDADIPGLLSLLTRAGRVYAWRDRTAAAARVAQKIADEANEQLPKVTAAFALFGFDVDANDGWSQLREAIGDERYYRALGVGIEQANVQAIDLQVEPVQPIQPEPEDKGTAPDHLLADGTGTSDRPSIRELVMQRLKTAGDAGSKARPIRDYIEKTYGITLHYKTVGMTLYRLLQDGLVRRVGQTWFIVPQVAETVNPGVGAPGSGNLFD